MTETKFRVFDKKTKQMWYGGFFIQGDTGDVWLDTEDGLQELPQEELIKMQFTGLKDKNGTEIYEEDIVKHHPEPNSYGGWWDGIVTWQPEGSIGWCIEPLPDNKHRGRYGMNYSYIFEVIGNIHSNPELIEDKNG